MRDLRFLVTFPAGFEEIVPLLLRRFLPSVKIVSRSGGMVLFSAPSADPLLKAPLFFTNVFAVVREWASPGISFPDMIHGIIKKDSLAGFAAPKIPGNSFRLRFSRASRFESVDKRFVQKAEEYIASSARMRLDKLSGGAEFWFLIRQEGPAYFACKLPQHPAKKGTGSAAGRIKERNGSACRRPGAAFRNGETRLRSLCRLRLDSRPARDSLSERRDRRGGFGFVPGLRPQAPLFREFPRSDPLRRRAKSRHDRNRFGRSRCRRPSLGRMGGGRIPTRQNSAPSIRPFWRNWTESSLPAERPSFLLEQRTSSSARPPYRRLFPPAPHARAFGPIFW